MPFMSTFLPGYGAVQVSSLTSAGKIIATRFSGSSMGSATDPTFTNEGALNDGMYNGGNGVFLASGGVARAVANEHHLGTVNNVPLSGAGRFVLENPITASVLADQNNYAPSGYGRANVLLLTPDAARSLTGFGAPSDTGVEVCGFVFVYNEATVAGRTLTFVHESASSDAGNRFTGYQAANVVIDAGGVALLRRVGNAATGRWVVRALVP